jgi:hypothetical protein
MTVTRGKAHVFLGMHITYNDDGTASIGMKEYLEEAIEDFGERITRFTASPAKRDLFEIDEKSKALGEEKMGVFHSVVAKLLYVSKRGRLDIQLTIAFLCTRVSCSTEKDWGKLRRLIEYLSGTFDEFLTLGANLGTDQGRRIPEYHCRIAATLRRQVWQAPLVGLVESNDTQIDIADARIDALRTWRCTGNSTVKTDSGDNRSRTSHEREIARDEPIKDVTAICARSTSSESQRHSDRYRRC